MKKTVDFQVLFPTQYNVIDVFIGVLELFGVNDDILIGIFQ